jgi:hypothetical protein
MDDDEIRRIVIRGHRKVIGHCRVLLASRNLRGAERATVESRLAIEERALNDLLNGDDGRRQVA